MTREELLLELRDIAPPAEPAWWLPGPGHLLLVIIALVILAILWYRIKIQRSRRWLLLARSELARIATAFDDSGDTRQLSLQLSRWLKQVAVLAYPQQKPHGLSGDDWLEFLDRALGGNRFSRGEGRVFADTVYRRRVDADAADLLDLCQAWLQAVTPRLLRRS